ncbi:MAG TPA: polysaccharide deacetylase family protein [Vicinamibacteria bacterium]|nr:polysaccharide deacetylase family protein [Vicinamibacteria bacterium]HRB11875.1 polysaccharide deacetylase family protein [Vicinamibacteria bacterium]
MTPRAVSCLVLCAGLGLSNGFAWSKDPAPPPRPALPAAPAREVAVTFDDLPAVSVARGDTASLAVFTDRLLLNFTTHQVPVTGFVNEGKLTVSGEGLEGQEARLGLLRRWLARGFELGNHTYSHRSLNELAIEEFQADVVRGEPATAALMGTHGRRLRYFRHPFLQVGLDLQKRHAFEAWLGARGYTVAPVTIDNDDYIFAAVYANALKGGETDSARRAGEAYLKYMDTVFDFHEALSQSLFGRPIRHVLLLHANELNADYSGKLFERLRERNYEFVPLARALEDPAYASPDAYVGRWGISWLHHWEQAMGRPRTGAPDPPSWVSQAYEKGRK